MRLWSRKFAPYYWQTASPALIKGEVPFASRSVRPLGRRIAIWSMRTRVVLARRLCDKLSLTEIARAVFSSPFHLARIFRRETGVSLHRQLTVCDYATHWNTSRMANRTLLRLPWTLASPVMRISVMLFDASSDPLPRGFAVPQRNFAASFQTRHFD